MNTPKIEKKIEKKSDSATNIVKPGYLEFR